jgi:hypothetical protein
MKLQQFNFAEAIKGAKVVTRDGREATQLTRFNDIGYKAIYGVVGGYVYCWDDIGEYDVHEINNLDLFLVAEPKRVWVNVFQNKYGDLYTGKTDYESKEMAIRCKDNMDREQYIKTIEITNEV